MKKQLPIPAAPGRGSIAQGFQPSIQAVADQLAVEARSLKARLDIGDVEGEPAAYQGVRVFEPEITKFPIDTKQDWTKPTQNVNYVVRDGNVYDIPIIVPGPGVFIATGITVAITQRHFDAPAGVISEQNYSSNWTSFDNDVSWTTKFALWPRQPDPNAVVGGRAPEPMINFFWNLLDARTGDLYSDQMLNHLLLKPRQQAVDIVPDLPYVSFFPDGGLLKFDTPWVFPYGSQVIFKFQPITPVVQLDSTIGPAASGLNYEDREGTDPADPTKGVRNQSVTVRAVLHGYRMMVAPGF